MYPRTLLRLSPRRETSMLFETLHEGKFTAMAGVFGNQGSIRAHSACSPVNPGKATYGNGVIINERKSKGLSPLRHTRHLDGERTNVIAVTTQFRRRIFSKTIGSMPFSSNGIAIFIVCPPHFSPRKATYTQFVYIALWIMLITFQVFQDTSPPLSQRLQQPFQETKTRLRNIGGKAVQIS